MAMFALTRREQTVIALVLAALLIGTVVKHWRAARTLPGHVEGGRPGAAR